MKIRYCLAVAGMLFVQGAIDAARGYTFYNATDRDVFLPVIYLNDCPNRHEVTVKKADSYYLSTACTGIDSVSFGYKTGDGKTACAKR